MFCESLVCLFAYISLHVSLNELLLGVLHARLSELLLGVLCTQADCVFYLFVSEPQVC